MDTTNVRNRRNASIILPRAAGIAGGKPIPPREQTSWLSAVARCMSFCSAVLLFCSAVAFGQTNEFQTDSSAGAGQILVHSQFGGQIFGFDIDQNGTEGLLSEAKTFSNGNVLAAVETFDQTTGKILKVVALTPPIYPDDDFITLGVVVNSVGLVEHEHVQRGFVVQRTFNILNPLDSNSFTGSWTPPIGTQHI